MQALLIALYSEIYVKETTTYGLLVATRPTRSNRSWQKGQCGERFVFYCRKKNEEQVQAIAYFTCVQRGGMKQFFFISIY